MESNRDIHETLAKAIIARDAAKAACDTLAKPITPTTWLTSNHVDMIVAFEFVHAGYERLYNYVTDLEARINYYED